MNATPPRLFETNTPIQPIPPLPPLSFFMQPPTNNIQSVQGRPNKLVSGSTNGRPTNIQPTTLAPTVVTPSNSATNQPAVGVTDSQTESQKTIPSNQPSHTSTQTSKEIIRCVDCQTLRNKCDRRPRTCVQCHHFAPAHLKVVGKKKVHQCVKKEDGAFFVCSAGNFACCPTSFVKKHPEHKQSIKDKKQKCKLVSSDWNQVKKRFKLDDIRNGGPLVLEKFLNIMDEYLVQLDSVDPEESTETSTEDQKCETAALVLARDLLGVSALPKKRKYNMMADLQELDHQIQRTQKHLMNLKQRRKQVAKKNQNKKLNVLRETLKRNSLSSGDLADARVVSALKENNPLK